MTFSSLQQRLTALRRLDAEADALLDRCYALASQLWESENPRWIADKAELSKAYPLFRVKAAVDDPRAQALLACAHLNGWSVPKEPEKALPWMRLAAEKGEALAQVNYGYMLIYSEGVLATDEKEGNRWLRLAADQGDTDACNHLGISYLRGRGVTRDDAEAAALFRKAADKNEGWGLYLLGFCHEEGRGVTKDLSEAITLYRRSAEQGYKTAIDALKRLKQNAVL